MGAWEQKPYTDSGETSRSYRKGTHGADDAYPSGITKYRVVREAIRGIQHTLNATGAELTVDGLFGTKTDEAVRLFQADHGLVVDGLLGPNTARTLFGLLIDEYERGFGIPDRILHGKTNLESGYDPGAVGVNGWDIGIAQINLDPERGHGNEISLEQACDPTWALRYTAERHDNAYEAAKRTLEPLARDAAIGQHNSPLAVKQRLECALRWPMDPVDDASRQRIDTNINYVRLVRDHATPS